MTKLARKFAIGIMGCLKKGSKSKSLKNIETEKKCKYVNAIEKYDLSKLELPPFCYDGT